MKIGDEVQTNDENRAFIVGMILGKSLDNKDKMEGTIPYAWNKTFPGWQDKMVYYIEFEKPVRQCTMKNIEDSYAHLYTYEKMVQIYESQPYVNMLAVPEYGVELV